MIGFVIEIGGGIGSGGAATGTSEKRPVYGYGPPAGRNGVDGFGDLHTFTVYVPPASAPTL